MSPAFPGVFPALPRGSPGYPGVPLGSAGFPRDSQGSPGIPWESPGLPGVPLCVVGGCGQKLYPKTKEKEPCDYIIVVIAIAIMLVLVLALVIVIWSKGNPGFPGGGLGYTVGGQGLNVKINKD